MRGCLKNFATTNKENNNICFECWSTEMDSEFGADKPFHFNWLHLALGLISLVILFLVFT